MSEGQLVDLLIRKLNLVYIMSYSTYEYRIDPHYVLKFESMNSSTTK